MKFQCSCGAKYALDIVPGMGRVTFVCQVCGQDYSDIVNDLIRQQTAPGQSQAPAPAAPESPATPALPPAAIPPAEEPAPAGGSRLRISREQTPVAAPQAQEPASKYCARHRTELTTDQCQVCHKPICPQCIDTFGPYCSPFCRNKMEGASMTAPSWGGRKFATEREFWRKTGKISTVIGLIAFAFFGFWFWYAWIGSVPKVYFSVRWDDISHSGGSWIANGNQLVFLHGGTLARYDLQTKRKIWSLQLVSQQQIDAVLKQEDEEAAQAQREDGKVPDGMIEPINLRQKHARIGLEGELSLHGAGKNIWVASGDSMTHYDWDTGNILQNITVTNGIGDLKAHGDELLASSTSDSGAPIVTHINMDDGQMSTEQFSASGPATVAQRNPRADAQSGGGLPLSSRDDGQPLNPQKVAEQAQHLSLPARIALPALLGNAQHNRQINAEIASEDRGNRPAQKPAAAPAEQLTNLQDFTFIPDGDSYLAFASRMTRENMVEHEAMKAPPKKSALSDPNLSTANETAAVNEQLNDIQRINGGGKVEEDQSTYQVAIRRPNESLPDWTGTVVGPPQLYPLQTVNVIAAGKTIIALDKSDKKIWQAQLTYDVNNGDPEEGPSQYGAGPVVEHDGTLYVFDQAVLTAFDPATGNARWRIPSVGIVGLFFDNKGMIYVNTTSGSPDDIKYSRQIDVTKQTEAIVTKIDPASGKVLWSYNPGGYISYLSGKFIFACRYSDSGDDDEQLFDGASGLQNPSYLKIIRINPGNGHEMWDHEEGRAPMDIQFNGNMISIIFKKEVEVLKFFSL